jgi:hypothetical protein
VSKIFYDCFDAKGRWLSTVEGTDPEDAKEFAERILEADPFYDESMAVAEVWPNTRGFGYYPRDNEDHLGYYIEKAVEAIVKE